jgi:hypothetical protein
MTQHMINALAAGDADAAHYKLHDFGNALAIIDSRALPERSIVWAGPAADRSLAEKELANLKMRARLKAIQATAKAVAKQIEDQNMHETRRSICIESQVLREMLGDWR